MASALSSSENTLDTQILACSISQIGQIRHVNIKHQFLDGWSLDLSKTSADGTILQRAAAELRRGDIPVAFPTETVYGLGADATRSSAVQGIYKAKQRPSDNPLIVHISCLSQLRHLLDSQWRDTASSSDPIPAIYEPLMSKFWPGPLTILLPLPEPSPFAPEVSANLQTVGVRMPLAPLALSLIKLAGVPLAAPSANTSSKPSPTTAAHVFHDLNGRINTILDGGPCNVGLESTVVDGLSDPPLILRPGAISLQMLKSLPGWENVKAGYTDGAQVSVPRAPGMKYKHYSPKARVLITRGRPTVSAVRPTAKGSKTIGILRTNVRDQSIPHSQSGNKISTYSHNGTSIASPIGTACNATASTNPATGDGSLDPESDNISSEETDGIVTYVADIGPDINAVARNFFSSLRALDLQGCEMIFIESLEDREGDLVAAIMNRLKKAAETEIDLRG